MRTPRPNAPRRGGIGTLIGNGWLHESPRNFVPRGWDLRGKSVLRKCMFMPSPYAGLLPEMPREEPKARAPIAPPKPVESPAARKIDPARHARVLPAYVPQQQQMTQPQPQHAAKAKEPAWYEDPIALGSLLILVPPVGLAALWSSRRYSNDARWALTIMTGLTMALATAVFVSLLVLRTR